jgi:hypothetical protein
MRRMRLCGRPWPLYPSCIWGDIPFQRERNICMAREVFKVHEVNSVDTVHLLGTGKVDQDSYKRVGRFGQCEQ